MDKKKLDQLVLQLENYLECWKQFNHYVALARTKKFGPEDESQFLEIKCVIAQELELIMSAIETENPTREQVHSILEEAPSVRYLSEMSEPNLRGLENRWHKTFIGWQSILGQLKVQQRKFESQSFWSSLFAKKKG
jgi:hypothetical protein